MKTRRKNKQPKPKKTQKTQSVLLGLQGSVNFDSEIRAGDEVIIEDTTSFCLDEGREYYTLGSSGTVVNFLKGGAEVVVRVAAFDRVDPMRIVAIPERFYICKRVFKKPY
jgi:hypothetical protein